MQRGSSVFWEAFRKLGASKRLKKAPYAIILGLIP